MLSFCLIAFLSTAFTKPDKLVKPLFLTNFTDSSQIAFSGTFIKYNWYIAVLNTANI